MGEVSTFIQENRHVFSVCPECDSISRLSDLEIARRGTYVPDWLDRIEQGLEKAGQTKFALEQRAKELTDKARRQAEAEILPKRLKEIAPSFARCGLDPRDVSALLDPVEFVVFDGMSGADGVRRVIFLAIGERSRAQTDLERAIESKSYDWNLLRVGDDGKLSQSKKTA
jgi:predicted Holliday junction resolvase-like endonuclease